MNRENEPTLEEIRGERDPAIVRKDQWSAHYLSELLPSPLELEARAYDRDLSRRIFADLPPITKSWLSPPRSHPVMPRNCAVAVCEEPISSANVLPTQPRDKTRCKGANEK